MHPWDIGSNVTGHHLVAFLFVLANFATALRLACYQRRGARYRLGMSVVAYLMVVLTGGQALDVLARQGSVTPWQLGLTLLLAFLVFRARGNVANIAKPARAR
ncbi:phage holin family protein [Achromobacter sp. DH1f]|uniref:phage holin family protein n=1 Tax=Achromobacter sp. DH1f TaxID=1397275 RepID=UPI00068EA86E|nr:phage holin family protein [Achromobacter sp. DH1f]